MVTGASDEQAANRPEPPAACPWPGRFLHTLPHPVASFAMRPSGIYPVRAEIQAADRRRGPLNPRAPERTYVSVQSANTRLPGSLHGPRHCPPNSGEPDPWPTRLRRRRERPADPGRSSCRPAGAGGNTPRCSPHRQHDRRRCPRSRKPTRRKAATRSAVLRLQFHPRPTDRGGGAADLYASANEHWMDYLEERDLIVSESRVKPDRQCAGAGRTRPMPGAVRSIRPTRTAIAEVLGPTAGWRWADPDHVPAGIYARQALESLGHWEVLRDPAWPAPTTCGRAGAGRDRRGWPLGIVYATRLPGSATWCRSVARTTFPPFAPPPAATCRSHYHDRPRPSWIRPPRPPKSSSTTLRGCRRGAVIEAAGLHRPRPIGRRRCTG